MKWLVALLLCINLGLFAYFNLELTPKSQALSSQHQPVNPEQIQLLSEKEIEALPKKVAQVAPPPPTPSPVASVEVTSPPEIGCYEWGSFSNVGLFKARKILLNLSLQATIKPQSKQEAIRYWVYIPKLRSAELAQAKAAEVKALGVTDLFVVQEPLWRNAISFGVFQDEQLALNLLTELKAKGVNSAVKGVRNQEKGQASLVIQNMLSTTAKELEQLKPEFPGSELKKINCT
jgi:hypothetical protein